jgi:hypothetical protein
MWFCRYLQDPEGQAVFVAEQLAAAAVIDMVPADSHSCNSSRPGTSSSSKAACAAARPMSGIHTTQPPQSTGVPVGAAAGPEQNDSKATKKSIVGSFGYYSAWTLLDLWMVEWLKRMTAAAGRQQSDR